MAAPNPGPATNDVGDEINKKFKSLGEFPGSFDESTWLERAMELAFEAASYNRPSIAVPIYSKCISIAQKEWGIAELETLEFQRAQANELLKLEKFKEADENFQQIVALAEQRLSNPALEERAEFLKHVEDIAEARIELATALKDKSKFDVAAMVSNDNFKVCKRVLGADHRFTKQTKIARDECLEKKKEEEEEEARKEQERKAKEERAVALKQAGNENPVLPGQSGSPSLPPTQPDRGRQPSQSAPLTPAVNISGPTQQPQKRPSQQQSHSHYYRLKLVPRTPGQVAKDPSNFVADNAATVKNGSLSLQPQKGLSHRSHSVGEVDRHRNLLVGQKVALAGELKKTRSQDLNRKSPAPQVATPPATQVPQKKGGAQLLIKENAETHPSDIWLGQNLRDSHSLFVKRDDFQFSSDPAFKEPKYKRRVRIAILDTGIDLNHPHVKRKIKRIPGTRAFIDEAKQTNDCSDLDGHGTHLAMLLNKVAPEADIYVARVFKSSQGESDSPVADALMHAVDEWDVDIICMSFGFSNSKKGIEQAILRAAGENKLMFAAATNDGGNVREAMFPARHPNVFCIHATNSDGAWADFNTRSRDADYSTLGVQVKSVAASCRFPPPSGTSESNPADAKPKLTERRDGTSIATAIAAGIAALILEFARMPDVEGPYSYVLDQEELDHLHTFEGMKRVLDSMCFTDIFTKKTKYLAPWQLITLDKDRLDPKIKRRAARNCLKALSVALLP